MLMTTSHSLKLRLSLSIVCVLDWSNFELPFLLVNGYLASIPFLQEDGSVPDRDQV